MGNFFCCCTTLSRSSSAENIENFNDGWRVEDFEYGLRLDQISEDSWCPVFNFAEPIFEYSPPDFDLPENLEFDLDN